MSKTGRRWARRRFSIKTIDALPTYLNLMALSKSLGVSLSTVQHWVKLGLKAKKVGARWEVRKSDLKRFLQETQRLIGAISRRQSR